jgi:hypothetical protein
MTDPLDSSTSEPEKCAGTASGKLRMGLIALASAVGGGLAVAWWYRNTLAKLNQETGFTSDTEIGKPEDGRS